MKVTVELVYEEGSTSKVDLEISDRLQGGAVLNAVDRKLNGKAFKDDKWTRWNLISIERGPE